MISQISNLIWKKAKIQFRFFGLEEMEFDDAVQFNQNRMLLASLETKTNSGQQCCHKKT